MLNRYHLDAARSDFWQIVCSSGLNLITTAEVASSDVSPEQAFEFGGQRAQGDVAAAAAGDGAAVRAVEELDDME